MQSISQIGDEPVIGVPTIDPFPQSSDQNATITVSVADPDGIKNATLFWRYDSINTTVFDQVMTGATIERVVDIQSSKFPGETYLNSTGNETQNKNNWMLGNFSYEASQNRSLTWIDLQIAGEGGNNGEIVYYRLEGKNITSGEWQLITKNGSRNATSYLDPFSFNTSEVLLGFRIYTVTYSSNQNALRGPDLNYLYIDSPIVGEQIFTGVIPQADPVNNTPTYVSYWITAFDTLDNSNTSSIYTFLRDWAPELTLHNIPSKIKGNEDFFLNLTVTDLDGLDNIDDTSVVAYYRLEGENEWSSVPLIHIIDVDFLSIAIYNGTIPTSIFTNSETNLLIMINASDTVGGQKGLEGSTGIISIPLDSLAPRLTTVTVEGGAPIGENLTQAYSEVNITADFEDPSGISSVFIYYSDLNGSISKVMEMTNLTLKAPDVSPVTFFATLPAQNETGFVEYLFKVNDFLGNEINTSKNFYYVDASPPILEELLIFPSIKSNITEVTILFNATDPSGVQDTFLNYSFDNGSTWSSDVASILDYTQLKD
ncbi:MAG: hypothetical protein ACXAC7_06425, partial [Candidatus Hodarchaeales archaeon]